MFKYRTWCTMFGAFFYRYSDDIKSGFGYNGEEQDETGLIYLRARYYNPVIGQFIQLDENRGNAGNIESQNRYAYALNNPNKYIDKNGRAARLMNDGGSSKRKSGGFSTSGRSSGAFNLGGLAKGGITDIVKNEANKAAKSIKKDSKNAKKDKYKPKPPQDQRSPKAETISTTRPTYIPEPCPETAEQREARLDSLQNMLNAIGIIPGFGEIADGINAGIYYKRGMEFEALISAGCAVFPLVADAVLKPFLYAAGNAVDKVFKISQKIDGFLPTIKNFISGISTKVDNVLFGFKEAKARLKNICDDFIGYINRLSNEVNKSMHMQGF